MSLVRPVKLRVRYNNSGCLDSQSELREASVRRASATNYLQTMTLMK